MMYQISIMWSLIWICIMVLVLYCYGFIFESPGASWIWGSGSEKRRRQTLVILLPVIEWFHFVLCDKLLQLISWWAPARRRAPRAVSRTCVRAWPPVRRRRQARPDGQVIIVVVQEDVVILLETYFLLLIFNPFCSAGSLRQRRWKYSSCINQIIDVSSCTDVRPVLLLRWSFVYASFVDISLKFM